MLEFCFCLEQDLGQGMGRAVPIRTYTATLSLWWGRLSLYFPWLRCCVRLAAISIVFHAVHAYNRRVDSLRLRSVCAIPARLYGVF